MGEPERTVTNSEDAKLLAALSAKQKQQLDLYLEALLETNKHFNLTAVRTREEAWQRHVIESLHLLPLLGEPDNLLDVGSGGGLPGMILSIARPDIRITLLEATKKKASFLSQTANDLGLLNLRVVNERAETAGEKDGPLRESFHAATARAVAPLATLLELTIPFLKVGGKLIAVKGEKADDEVASAERAMKLLGCRLTSSVRQSFATVLLIEKVSQTRSTYPRRPGDPKHHPL